MADDRLNDELFQAARNYNDITWEDPDGDRKLKGILQRGMTRLDKIAGEKLTYEEGTDGRELLLDYSRYARSGTLPDFEDDFSSELLELHMDQEVQRYAETADSNVQ